MPFRVRAWHTLGHTWWGDQQMYGATHGFPSFDEHGKRIFCLVDIELYLQIMQPRQEFQDQPSGD
jgi:hypothetical protein